MQNLFLVLLLAAIVALFSARVRKPVERWLARRPYGILIIAVVLSATLSTAAAFAGAFNRQFASAVIIYTLLPSTTALVTRRMPSPTWAEPLIFALLWLPLEFPVGAGLVPRHAHGFVHSAAYGVAILLALSIFLLFRKFDGMRYRLPTGKDIGLALLGFAIAAPILVIAGRIVGFIPPFHSASLPPLRLAWIFSLILAATALPEEILFRSLIQNWIVRRFGASNHSIAVSALIFGAAHLNNGPGASPNWRYALVATIAGFAFGKVFQRSSSVLSSALVHALVNTTKRAFF
jgi:membrane protease YdiL (CAAX protease family)